MKSASCVIQLLTHAIVQGIMPVHAPAKPEAIPVTKPRAAPATEPTKATHPRAGALPPEGVPSPIELPEEGIVIIRPKHPVLKLVRALARAALFCEATFEANKHVNRKASVLKHFKHGFPNYHACLHPK
jgi:hypothetical protein